MNMDSVTGLYDAVLGQGQAGTDAYYACLRRHGIHPTPDETGDLYAPNPVLVDGVTVDAMTADLNRFVAHRRQAVRDPADLLACMEPDARADFASPDVAAAVWADLQAGPPLAQLDTFLTETEDGLAPVYLEWQTCGSYATLAGLALGCAQAAWPALRDAGPCATRGWTLADLDARLKALYTRGIEDDPRQGVVIDYNPPAQVTRREFAAIQALTGGERGLGVIDPRQAVYVDRRPHYRRDGQLVPIRRVYSRLVHSEMVGKLIPACSAEERRAMRRLFGDATLSWISHPLHFYYGTKAHFSDFYAAGLSPRLPATWTLTDELIGRLRREGRDPLDGLVYKPAAGQGGMGVTPDPPLAALAPGGLLQARIHPAACHRALAGPRVPEIRLMAIPDGDKLVGAAVFTRVMAPGEFLSNAGVIAARAVPGTGEGYGFVVWGERL